MLLLFGNEGIYEWDICDIYESIVVFMYSLVCICILYIVQLLIHKLYIINYLMLSHRYVGNISRFLAIVRDS